MEKKEIKRTRPEAAHDCNLCEECQESIRNVVNKCGACKFLFFEKLYKDFSSGNKVIDEIIKNPIYTSPTEHSFSKVNYYEWIPWESLSDINKIGEGGFGTIYKATFIDGFIRFDIIKHHGSIEYETWGKGMEVAIKFMKSSSKNSNEVFKELNIQRTMFNNNDSDFLYNISKIYGITQNTETFEYGIVIHLARYGDMRKHLSTNFHYMSWKDKLVIAQRIAWGLSMIHSFGMVHRDLHSGNILIYYSRTVQIGDLGLCQPTNNEATTTGKATKEKKIYGVIPYIPPEVLRGEKFTTSGDIYSFAMILWELATGKPPFHDYPHDEILIMAILNGQRPNITSPLIPPSIGKLIKKCWDANSKNRPTAEEIWKKSGKLGNLYNNIFKRWIYFRTIKFSKSIQPLKKTMKHDKKIIHTGAVYTSRPLTAQMIHFSKG
ncbi:hypothetical protein G9A89_023582 [Geosiphon pyriformis]|nr:hypothetical protein G9A89_023582 [Geosiphon pyriformis]